MTKVAFVDSGTGGLMFLSDFITNLPSEHRHNFEFLHIGDNANVPYGLKTDDQLVVLTKNLIDKSVDLGCKIVVIACNTASTIVDEKMISEYGNLGIKIINILKKSGDFLYETAKKFSKNKQEVDLAIFATHQTITSNKYFDFINQEHLFQNPDIKLNIHQYNPRDIEFRVEEDLRDTNLDEFIDLIMHEFKQKIGKIAFENISGIGLFCTHYPLLKNDFYQYFLKYRVDKNVSSDIFCSQGKIFIDEVLSYCDGNQEGNSFEIKSYWTKDIESIPLGIINRILPSGYAFSFSKI